MNNEQPAIPSPEAKRDLLVSVMGEVFEQFAFMFLEPASQDVIPAGRIKLYEAAIHFEGPLTGRLAVCAPLAFCHDLAASVLGFEDDQITSEHERDALKELVNVACGEWLVAIAGNKHLIDLSVPTFRELDAKTLARLTGHADAVPVLVDDHPLLFEASFQPS